MPARRRSGRTSTRTSSSWGVSKYFHSSPALTNPKNNVGRSAARRVVEPEEDEESVQEEPTVVASPPAAEDEPAEGDADGDAVEQVETPAAVDEAEGDDEEQGEEEAAEDEDDEGEDEEEEEEEEEPSTPAPPPPPPPRGRLLRRPGRPPKHARGTRAEDWGSPDPLVDEVVPRGTPTPRRGRGRGRGRGGGGTRGRGGRLNRGPSHLTQVPIDKAGNMMDVIDDEVDLPEDADGEAKVDKFGRLQGGREYRVRTFKLAGRGERLYMLSTEPARCTGFRDSYLFFAKHPTLYKIIIGEEEKKDLIERELIPHSYKGRAIGVVTARSVFREFGCKIVVGGKKITDDYRVAEARARGDKEGDLADPADAIPPPGRMYNRNQYVAWHGASAVYHSSATPAMPQGGKPNIMGKRKANLTTENWMYEHALAASRCNSALALARRSTLDGVYNAHLNIVCYPRATQPTHARWERLPSPPPPPAKRRRLDEPPSKSTLHLTNGDGPHSSSRSFESVHHEVNGDVNEPASKIFTALTPALARNYMIVDTHFQSPASPGFGAPGAPIVAGDGGGDHDDLALDAITDSASYAAGGLPALGDADAAAAALPRECRDALRAARRLEAEWRGAWASEAADGLRGRLRLGIGT